MLQMMLLRRLGIYISKGYTMAFAKTAPVAPAMANPQGGIDASFERPAMGWLLRRILR
jgi:hypothetical protein